MVEARCASPDGFNTLLLIVRLVSLFSPLRVFLPVSGLMLAIGVWYMVESYLLFQEASVKALLAMLASLLFFLFGLLADQVAALRRGEAVLRPTHYTEPGRPHEGDQSWRAADASPIAASSRSARRGRFDVPGTGVTPTRQTRGAHLLTFDAEHWYEGYRLRGFGGWENVPARDPATIERLLRLLAKYPTSGQRSSRLAASLLHFPVQSARSSRLATRSRRTASITRRCHESAGRRHSVTICSVRSTSCETWPAGRSTAFSPPLWKVPEPTDPGCWKRCCRKDDLR